MHSTHSLRNVLVASLTSVSVSQEELKWEAGQWSATCFRQLAWGNTEPRGTVLVLPAAGRAAGAIQGHRQMALVAVCFPFFSFPAPLGCG